MRFGEAFAQLAAAGFAKLLVRSPPTRGEALRAHKIESVARCAQVFFVAKNEVSLHGAAQGIDVTVRVLSRKHVFARCQRIPIPVVGEVTLAHFLVAASAAALPGQKEVLWQRIGLIPAE